MKEFENEKGLWQSVEDQEIEKAKDAAEGLSILVGDTYKGREITDVTFEDNPPKEIINKIGTTKAVLFHLTNK